MDQAKVASLAWVGQALTLDWFLYRTKPVLLPRSTPGQGPWPWL